MEMSGEYRIKASREQVWAALNDPEILKASIPGCDSLEQSGENDFSAQVTAKVGPVKAKFKGEVQLSDIDPPNGYTISGEGKGGAAGFAKGGAEVQLEEDGDETVLTYRVKANVGGKMAQLGARLIDGTAKKLSDEFFMKFSELAQNLEVEAAPATFSDETMPAQEPEIAAEALGARPESGGEQIDSEPPAKGGIPIWAWILGVVVVIAIVQWLLP
jgi:carbon monoxide dehydrogenase subunit G